MGYQFADTFDNYNNPAMMYSYIVGSPTISSSYTRYPAISGFPNQGIYLPAGSYIQRGTFGEAYNLIVFLTYGGPLPTSGYCSIFSFSTGPSTSNIRCFLAVTSAGALAFYNYSGTLLATSSNGIIQATSKPSYGIEMQVDFAVGSVQCWLGGVQVIALTTGISFSGYGAPNVIGVGYAPSIGGTATNIYCDYLRVWDNTGANWNTPVKKDVRKLTKLPTGAASISYGIPWNPTPSTNTTWQCVSNNPPLGNSAFSSSFGTEEALLTGNNCAQESYTMGIAGLSGTTINMVLARSYIEYDYGINDPFLAFGVSDGHANYYGPSVGPYAQLNAYTFVDSPLYIWSESVLGAVADALIFLKLAQ